MDLMLQVAERVCPQEIPEALEVFRVRLGLASAQLIMSSVITDVRWHRGFREVQDFSFYLETLHSCAGTYSSV